MENNNLPVNSAFHPDIPGLQIAWDSTSIGAFKTCPRKYQLSIIEGWNPRSLSVHLVFGQHYHKALERYDHSRSAGRDHEQSTIDAVRQALSDSWEILPDGRGRPWMSDDPLKNRETLVRTVVWYLEEFADDSAKTIQLANGKPAVELSFRFETDYFLSDGTPFLLCGHLDRLAELGDDTYVFDRKTTKNTLSESFFEGFSPNNQFSLYTLAAQVVYNTNVAGLYVDGAQIAVGFSRFQRAMSPRHHSQIEEWYKDFGLMLQLAQFYAAQQYWPMNDTACGNYGGCQFRGICSKVPGVREAYLKGSFTRRVWDPLFVRGDI